MSSASGVSMGDHFRFLVLEVARRRACFDRPLPVAKVRRRHGRASIHSGPLSSLPHPSAVPRGPPSRGLMRQVALGTCATQDVGCGRNAGKSLTSPRTIAASSSGSETLTPPEIVRIGSWRRFTGQSCLFLNPMSDGESSWLMNGVTATPGISRTRLRESDTATSREIFNVTWRVRVQTCSCSVNSISRLLCDIIASCIKLRI